MTELTYRFKLNSELSSAIKVFSLKYKNASRSDFKKSFDLWEKSNNELICLEQRRLLNLGYAGDFKDKIYKSARYYYKNKNKENPAKPETDDKKLSSTYIPRNSKFLEFVENYIHKHNMKQSLLYKQFINETSDKIVAEIENEINRLKTFQLTNKQSFQKIKKQFNNAYYKIKNATSKNATSKNATSKNATSKTQPIVSSRDDS